MSNDASPRPQKCARLSSNDLVPHASSDPVSQTMSNLTRHSEFWFDDGNIVLVAQHTGFRIYRRLLAAQSTVFADMFTSSSAGADEAFDGCPVVHLTDSHHDLTHLLRVLLPTSPGIRYHTTDPERVRSFDETSSVVRLAHKYHIQSVQDQAMRALQEFFTTDFIAPYTLQRRPQWISVTRIQCIGAVNLARLTDTPLLLPAALYTCCFLRGELLDGWTREDGTVEHLCMEDLKRCLNASIELGRQECFVVSRLFCPVPLQRCHDPNFGSCADCLGNVARSTMCMDIIVRWGRSGTGCKAVLLERTQAERRRIWDGLPQILGITVEGWAKPNAEGAANAA
ncbi:hypothetical protein LXA43DRAFT_1080214 [Ganoderma leucocontextum]|nr:hypothetical protein LXA43DRAFT_1080214 [Ganoderma leucocontextum]